MRSYHSVDLWMDRWKDRWMEGAEGRWIRDTCALKIYPYTNSYGENPFYRAHLGPIVPRAVSWSSPPLSGSDFKISLFAVKQRALM